MPLGRVRTRSSFAALRQHGRRARRGALRVVYVPATSGDVPVPCVAFGVGRQLGGAVARNRVRRRLRAACADLAPAPGTYLVTATPAAVSCSYQQLRADLADVLAAVGALPEPGRR